MAQDLNLENTAVRRQTPVPINDIEQNIDDIWANFQVIQAQFNVLNGEVASVSPEASSAANELFPSAAAATAHFQANQANRNKLRANAIIFVVEGGGAAARQWRGTPQPDLATYNSEAPSQWVTLPLRTSGASLEFEDELTLYDHGEFLAYDDRVNEQRFILVAQEFSDAAGSSDARQLSFSSEILLIDGAGNSGETSPSQTTHSWLLDTGTLVPENQVTIATRATINLVNNPGFYFSEIFEGTDDTGKRIHAERFEFTGVGEQTVRPLSVQRFKRNTVYFIRVTSDTAFQLRGETVAAPGGGTQFLPAQDVWGTHVTFETLATQNYVNTNMAGSGNFGDATFVGLLQGANTVVDALERIDATGLGADIFRFTGNYAASSANQSEWFDGRALVRMRGLGSGVGNGAGAFTFDLPGTSALNTIFNALVAKGLPEVFRLTLEYTGGDPFSSVLTNRLRVRPRTAPSPQIGGRTNINLANGQTVTLEITRSSGVLSSYQVVAGPTTLEAATGTNLDDIELQDPAVVTWDASATGVLPTNVLKGYAFRVVNAPPDGSGRFGEVMRDGDWIVWFADSFTSWSASPHQWFVMTGHDVRRITQLESDFLSYLQLTPPSSRNAVTRNAAYDTLAAEIRLKIYPTADDYDAADLNTTGDIDAYVNASNITGKLAIRLAGTQATLASTLPTLYVYEESGNTRLLNLARDFVFQGDFGNESDYLSVADVTYEVGQTLRIFTGTQEDRFTNTALDIYEANLSERLQGRVNQREAWASLAEILLSGASARDVHAADRISYADGYSRGVDWRDMTESVTINENRYLDAALSITASGASFEVSGFGVGLQKVCGLQLRRNDGKNGVGAMMELAPGVAFIRVNTSNEIEVNTTPGSGTVTWEPIQIAFGGTGNFTLGAGDNNFLIFEVVPILGGDPGRYEVVSELFDGTNYFEADNVVFTPSGTVNGDHLGFSRSSQQRGEVRQFKAVNSPGYLRHDDLDSRLRHHRDDEWNFGDVRRYQGATVKDLIFQTGLVIQAQPNGTLVRLVADDTDLNDIKLGVEKLT